MRKLATGLAWIAALSSVACKDTLNAPDTNAPDIARSYSTPAVLDQLIATGYAQIHQGIFNNSTSIDPQMQVLSFENYATVANFGMNGREAMPRSPIDNSRNNFTAAEDFRDFSTVSQQARYSANYVQSLDALIAKGIHLGSPTGNSSDASVLPGQDLRARSFAFFENGVALGTLALAYDSAAIVTPATPSDAVPALSSHVDVMKTALASLDTALAIANDAKTAPGFPLPSNYINLPGGAQYTKDQYVRLIRSYKARFRAGVARTPAERAAVDWTQVIADATNGIQSDVVVQINGSAGWGLSWLGSQMFASNSAGWHEISPMIFGMADTSGGYKAWIAQPITARSPFLIKTPDKRFPSGETRTDQQNNSPKTWVYSSYPYMRNRASADPPGDGWGSSFYDFWRFKGIFDNNGQGPWIEMGKTEIDMLAAEGDIRKGDFASAAALINKSRTAAGLPPVTATADGGNTGSACVPLVPTPSGGTKCGDIIEAMKWEKRMETAYTGYGQWYFDARGWGDLPEGTALEWPVPYQEMDSRAHPFYNLGGVGGPSAAAKGTYGF